MLGLANVTGMQNDVIVQIFHAFVIAEPFSWT